MTNSLNAIIEHKTALPTQNRFLVIEFLVRLDVDNRCDAFVPTTLANLTPTEPVPARTSVLWKQMDSEIPIIYLYFPPLEDITRDLFPFS